MGKIRQTIQVCQLSKKYEDSIFDKTISWRLVMEDMGQSGSF